MGYAGYGYYKNQYGGNLLMPEFNRYAAKASTYLDNLTLGRIDEPVSDKIKRAVCELAEAYHVDEQRGDISSESNDGYSVTYKRVRIDTKLYQIAAFYLTGTGLLYRGIDTIC